MESAVLASSRSAILPFWSWVHFLAQYPLTSPLTPHTRDSVTSPPSSHPKHRLHLLGDNDVRIDHRPTGVAGGWDGVLLPQDSGSRRGGFERERVSTPTASFSPRSTHVCSTRGVWPRDGGSVSVRLCSVIFLERLQDKRLSLELLYSFLFFLLKVLL